ncbi:HdeD family acid-resistance protein [Actibacterium sp. D379-3]
MKIWSAWLIIGVLLVLGGIVALANPLAATLAVDVMVGVLFVIGGIVQLMLAFRADAGDGRFWTGLMGALGILVGVALLADPMTGAVSLTLMLGILLLVLGLSRLILAWGLKETSFFWLLVASGVISVLIGGLILSDFQAAATQLLGILLGIELIADGAGLIALGLIFKKL